MSHTPRPGTARWWTGADKPASLADIVGENARRTPDRIIFNRRTGASWEPVTASQFEAEVAQLALGFLAAGVAAGARVALMAKTRYEWTLVDAALWAVGAVTVPVYETSSKEQLRWILSDSAAVGCVVESRAQAAMLATLSDELPELRAHWVLDGDADDPTLDDLTRSGRGQETAELERRRDALRPDSLATIIYTSGTTGKPKGCQLTHGNFLTEVTSAIEALPELFEDEDAATLLFLPLAHVFGRMIQVAVVLSGVRTGHTDIARVTRDLPTFKPTFVLAVPRVFERIYDAAQRKATAGGKQRVFAKATDTAIAYSEALDHGGPGVVLRAQRLVFDRLVYAKIRAAFGGDLRWGVSGGAALGPRLGHFFRGVGITVLEGYGLTETTAACTVNTRAATRMGTVGRPMPRMEVRIAEGHEVLIRGGHVFTGYWHHAEATRQSLDDDGWFHTGDLGSIDDDGYLTITGRSKEILVTSAGKNVSPAPLEEIIRAHPLVSQAMVVGDGEASIRALVTVDAEAVALWLDASGRPATPVAELTQDEELNAQIQSAVDAANATVSSAEEIKRFLVLPVDLTEDAGHLTPTLKIKRAFVMDAFAGEVQALYASRR